VNALAQKKHNKIPVWIDTDPSCGKKKTDDVDDCWALLLAFRSPELDVRGISTVFGNTDGYTTFAVATEFVNSLRRDQSITTELPSVYRGADQKGRYDVSITTDATRALAEELKRGKLNVIAIGPLTNIATLIVQNPELKEHIERIIAVAGNRSGQGNRRFFLGKNRILHFHDLNFRKDTAAFEIVLNSGVPLHLLPFEAAQKVTVTREDATLIASTGGIAKWLVEQSDGWMQFWEKKLNMNGFYPFDCLAVGYAIDSSLFLGETLPAQIIRKSSRFILTRDELAVSGNFNNSPTVNYSYDVNSDFKKQLIARLSGNN
jgi:pyrimidine-specific ribonucleoside hydrolase